MPRRADSFPPMISSVVVVLLAMLAVNDATPVRADSACNEQPGPVAEGTHWILSYDRAKGRGCWMLVDGFGHETAVWGGPVTMPQTPATTAPAPSLPSQRESWFGNFNFTGEPANATPERSAPQISHLNPPHRLHLNVAHASRADNGDRADQKSNSKEHAAKRTSTVLISGEESAQFQEFLRWRERKQQFEDFLRWREREQLTGAMKLGTSSQR
jgi:hypothetical protein